MRGRPGSHRGRDDPDRQHRGHLLAGRGGSAAPAGLHWFQLYCYRDRGITRSLVERAVAAGYRAICLTVDTPYVGRREAAI